MEPKRRAILAASILAVLSSTGVAVYAQSTGHEIKTPVPAPTVAQVSSAQRDLWIDHIFWVRNVVLETSAGNTTAAAAAENAVVTNAKAIAASIEPFYGKAASKKLFGLLAGHYGAIKHYLEATEAESRTKQATAVKDATANAGEVATFLGAANPYLPLETLRGLLLAHFGYHVQQIRQLYDKKFQQEAQTWEAMKAQVYVIADALAGALARQFPAKFSK